MCLPRFVTRKGRTRRRGSRYLDCPEDCKRIFGHRVSTPALLRRESPLKMRQPCSVDNLQSQAGPIYHHQSEIREPSLAVERRRAEGRIGRDWAVWPRRKRTANKFVEVRDTISIRI